MTKRQWLLDVAAQLLRGARCPECSERHRNMTFHIRFDHPDLDGWWTIR